MGIVEVRKGPWKDILSQRTCQVIGNARIVSDPLTLAKAHLEGIALHRTKIELEPVKKGKSIQVYTDRSTGKPILKYLKMGQFETPESVVIYREDTGGEQDKNQLYWESPEEFGINFTPVVL